MTGSGEPRRGLDRGARALGLMCAGHEPCPGGAFSEFNEWTRVESRRETRTARGPSAEHRFDRKKRHPDCGATAPPHLVTGYGSRHIPHTVASS